MYFLFKAFQQSLCTPPSEFLCYMNYASDLTLLKLNIISKMPKVFFSVKFERSSLKHEFDEIKIFRGF